MTVLLGWLDGICLLLFVSFWLFCCFWMTLFMAHLGYLHCIRTFSMCSNSLVSNCGVEHMVLALSGEGVDHTVFCCKVVLNNPIIDQCGCAFCILFKWRFHLFEVLFSYPEMVWNHQVQLLLQWTGWKDPLCWCVCKTPCLTDGEPQRCHQHTSSGSLGGSCSIDGSVFIDLHVNIGHNWTYRWPHGHLVCSKNWFWNREYVLLRLNPAALWCYWLTRWFYLGVLYPITTSPWWYLLQMPLEVM